MGTGTAYTSVSNSLLTKPAILIVGILLIACFQYYNVDNVSTMNPLLSAIHFGREEHEGPPYGQQLSLDLSVKSSSNSLLENEEEAKNAILEVAKSTGMNILNINTSKIPPNGLSIMAAFGYGHITMQTWPEQRLVIIDVIARGSKIDLKEVLSQMAEIFKGDLDSSTYSIKRRGKFMPGDHDDDEGGEEKRKQLDLQFSPTEIMSVHKFKKALYEKQSSYQHVAVYEHDDPLEDEPDKMTKTKTLFLDGVLQSNVDDEDKYHETLVHPAFIASAVPPKRVLIVGGGEGGTLRETLKWSSVQTTTMVDLDVDVVKASREFLPSYSNCTGFGTTSCFDDPRTELFTEDFIAWFEKHMGNDICEKREEKKDKLYDIIVIDLLDTEELPEGQEWAEHLYSELFYQRIACALNPLGTIVTQFGESPEQDGAEPPLNRPFTIVEMERIEMFQKKIRTIQTQSALFSHTKVYDMYIPSFRAPWAFAVSMVPHLPGDVVSGSDEIIRQKNQGINDLQGSASRVDLKLKRGLLEKAYPLSFYNGAIQNSFNYAIADWKSFFCADKTKENLCSLHKKILMTTDHEDEWFEVKDKKTLVAKQNIQKGHVSGLWDAATSLEIPSTDLNSEKTRISKETGILNAHLKSFFGSIARSGGQGGHRDTVYESVLSLLAYAKPACDETPNFQHIHLEHPESKELWGIWHPLSSNIKLFEHAIFATHDVKKGERIVIDNSHWNSLGDSSSTQADIDKKLKEMCALEDSEDIKIEDANEL